MILREKTKMAKMKKTKIAKMKETMKMVIIHEVELKLRHGHQVNIISSSIIIFVTSHK